MPGKWFDVYSDGKTSDKWTSNLIVSNASKALVSALANMPSSSSIMVAGCGWTQATKRVTKTGAFVNYASEFVDSDYFLVRSGTGIATTGTLIRITGVDPTGDYITLETDLHGSNISDGSVSGTIFKSFPRFHNLYLAIGTGSSSWDSETPYPSKSATQLTGEFYRKLVSRIVHIQEYDGLASAATSTTITSPSFAAFSTDCIGQLIEIVDGTGVGQVRQIISFNTSTNQMTISSGATNWVVTPDTTSKWRIGIPQHTATGVIDVITTFEQNEGNANGTIREMGLFGADATDVLGSGQLINLINHTGITKNSTNSLTRIIRLRLEVV